MLSLYQCAHTVILSALICGILLSIAQNSGYEPMLRLLFSVFLSIIVFSSLLDKSWLLEPAILKDMQISGNCYVQEGMDLAQQEARRMICTQMQTYITDKANIMGADIVPIVTVGEDLFPEQVEIRGKVGSDVKRFLSDMMENDLNIAKDHQLWTG